MTRLSQGRLLPIGSREDDSARLLYKQTCSTEKSSRNDSLTLKTDCLFSSQVLRLCYSKYLENPEPRPVGITLLICLSMVLRSLLVPE